MGTVFLADGKDMVTRERKTIAVGTLRDPDDPLPFHTRYYGDARRGIHPRHREKIGKVLTASSKAEQKGLLQPLGGKESRNTAAELQHDVDSLQVPGIYRALPIANHIFLKAHKVRPRPQLTEHNIHAVLGDLDFLGPVVLRRQRAKLC